MFDDVNRWAEDFVDKWLILINLVILPVALLVVVKEPNATWRWLPWAVVMATFASIVTEGVYLLTRKLPGRGYGDMYRLLMGFGGVLPGYILLDIIRGKAFQEDNPLLYGGIVVIGMVVIWTKALRPLPPRKRRFEE